VWSFVVNLRTKFLSVAIVSLPFHGDIENPNYNVVLGQRIHLFLGSGRVALGAGQTLAACPDCVAEIRFLNEPGWVTVEADVGKCVRWKYRARAMQRSLTDAAEQLICNQQVIGSNPIAGSVECQRLTNEAR
jgi:hypothetical protein